MINFKKIKLLTSILFVCFCLSSCSREYSSTKEEDYVFYLGEVLDAELYMPKLEELGKYNAMLVTRKTPNDIFFDTTDAIALIIQYDQEQYIYQTSEILNSYKFLEEGIDYVTDVEATVNGFDFKIVDDIGFYAVSNYGNYALCPNNLLILGYDEVNYRIAYLYHWDHSIDYIKDLDSFIEQNYVLN